MRKTYNIEIGSKVKVVNALGIFLSFLGTLTFFLTGIILWKGNFLPLEMKELFFAGGNDRTLYLTFVFSLIATIAGSQLAAFRKFELTELEIDEDRIILNKRKKGIETRNERIYKIIPQKSTWSGKKRLNIKTMGLEVYELRMNKSIFLELTNLYSNMVN